jgi:hypothetical protein
VFRREDERWTVRILPPAATATELGYVEQDPAWKAAPLSIR